MQRDDVFTFARHPKRIMALRCILRGCKEAKVPLSVPGNLPSFPLWHRQSRRDTTEGPQEPGVDRVIPCVLSLITMLVNPCNRWLRKGAGTSTHHFRLRHLRGHIPILVDHTLTQPQLPRNAARVLHERIRRSPSETAQSGPAFRDSAQGCSIR